MELLRLLDSRYIGFTVGLGLDVVAWLLTFCMLIDAGSLGGGMSLCFGSCFGGCGA